MIWFTADTHFGHERTLKLSRRPFSNTEEMDAYMIREWNKRVAANDTVFHLGDFGEYGRIKELSGNVRLLYGNYERADAEKRIITAAGLKEIGFDEINPHKANVLVGLFDETVRIVHEPSEMKTDHFHLFGHIHKLQMVKRNALNVGVDCHNFAPISADDVEFYMNAIKNHYDEEVFY